MCFPQLKSWVLACRHAVTMNTKSTQYKVGFLGIPCARRGQAEVSAHWSPQNMARLKELGFNTVQLSVAWGCRPADEPLNLEDIVELTPGQMEQYPQPVPLRCDPTPERRRQRRDDLKHRIALCRDIGMRTIFHFGAPYNAHCRYGDGPPNCIMDGKVIRRYELLIDAFAAEFPGVDDILVYTYDQDAWLCSEFGPCPHCLGVPLHQRLVPFLDRLAATWRRHSPSGLLWWEPWELSAGQVLRCIELVGTTGFGLALHANVAEVMATLPVDRWLKNSCSLALQRGIPAIVEYFLGGPSEELEPLQCLAHPLVTLRGLKAISALPGVCGIKEYYGLRPDLDDPNLKTAGLFFANASIDEDEALARLAEPYGPAAALMQQFWRLTSEAMELFPWDLSWYIREIGRSCLAHSLSAAMLRGQQCHTPSWFSTRHAIFMKTDDAQPDPWMIEDVELRCRLAAERWAKGLETGIEAMALAPAARRAWLEQNLADLDRLRRSAVAYACHLRETNLATCMRKLRAEGNPVPERLREELVSVMREDLANSSSEHATWPEMDEALSLLEQDINRFLETWLCEEPSTMSKGCFSVTSR
jgi:hypothetical protein